jgi:hypothetical protein
VNIKPIKVVPTVARGDLPQTKVDKHNLPTHGGIKLPSGTWQFNQGRLILNGLFITDLIESHTEYPPSFWSQVVLDLEAFRDQTIRKRLRKNIKKESQNDIDPTGELGQLAGLVDAYITKIMQILRKKYDETQDGLSFCLDEAGQLTLNGVNVTAFIETVQSYPTEKARLFLSGLKRRLGPILQNRSSSASYDKIYDITMKLFAQMDHIISKKTK